MRKTVGHNDPITAWLPSCIQDTSTDEVYMDTGCA